DKQAEYCEKVRKILAEKGFRVSADLRNEKIGFKIREHTIQKTPYLLVAGDRETENGEISVRTRDGQDLGVMSIDAFADYLANDIARFGRTAAH
ncbi:MAG: threonine--tRNA ligase, partial [Gammaproteobacteria bacterium]|nr:threonine--tRNA ligase [Gammaproteobacteria bacterium]